MKKPPLRGAIRAASPLVLADRGAEAMRLGRFKEAVEIFKQLARQDPRPEWTDRLADAYAGRAHALTDKGMFKEAAMVLDYAHPRIMRTLPRRYTRKPRRTAAVRAAPGCRYRA